jgi:hypothetical protein
MVAQTNRVKDEFWHAMERPKEIVHEYPISSMLLMFGVGIGVGVIVSQTLLNGLAEALEEPTMSEKMKRQLYDALGQVLPASAMRQLQSYTS